MPSLAIFLVLIAAMFQALRDFMTKQSKEKLLFVWWMTFFSLLILSPICIYFIIQTQPPLEALAFAIGMGLVHASYWTLYSKAYEHGDISHVYPIIHCAPAFVLVFGILFLQEKPDQMGILGILIVTIGLYLISMKNLHWKSLADPILSLIKDQHTQFAFLALFFVITYSLLDKVAVHKLHPMVYVFIMTISALSIFSIFIHKHIKKAWLRPIQTDFKKVIFAALFASINYPLALFALQLTNVSYIAGFRQISVIFAVLLGIFFLKEVRSKLRIFSACLIFLGAVLIAV